MTTHDPFRELAARLEFPDSPTLPEVLAMLVNTEEAEWLLTLPATPTKLAARINQPEAQIAEALHDLYMRGLVMVKETTPEPGEKREMPWTIFWEVIQEKPFWRFLLFIFLLLGVRLVFTHQFMVMPKYYTRVMGHDAPIGMLNAINRTGR